VQSAGEGRLDKYRGTKKDGFGPEKSLQEKRAAQVLGRDKNMVHNRRGVPPYLEVIFNKGLFWPWKENRLEFGSV